MTNETVLSSGARVVTECIPEFRSCTIGAWVDTGSRYESEENAGIAHFLEHILFKGTQQRSAYDIAKEMDALGGQLNAFTEKERTCFYSRVLDQHVPVAVDVLFDMLKNSLLDAEEVEREKGVILEEIKMGEDSPEDLALQRFSRSLWPNDALGRPIIGYKDVVAGMTAPRLRGYLESQYGASNLMVAAAGRVDHAEFVALVSRALEGYPVGDSGARTPAVECETQRLLFQKDCEQAYVYYGGRGLSVTDPRRYSFLVLDAVLGGSMSSRLFQEIREKRGLAYSVGTFQHSYQETGVFGVHAGTSCTSVEELLDVTDQILNEIRQSGLSADDLARSKELLKGHLALGLESTSNRMVRLARCHLNHGRYIEIEEVLEAVDDTSHKDVLALAEEFLHPENFSLTVLGAMDEVRGLRARPVNESDLARGGLALEVVS